AHVMLMDDNYQTSVTATRGDDRYETNIEPENFQFNALETPNFKVMLDSLQPLLVNDIHYNDLWLMNHTNIEYQSYLGVPIIEKDSVIGFINLESPEPEQFTAQHGEYLQLFASLASIAITNAR